MTVPAAPTPGDEVPRADWMEQQEDAEPVTEDSALPPATVPETNTVEASEADVLDQSTPVVLDDEV